MSFTCHYLQRLLINDDLTFINYVLKLFLLLVTYSVVIVVPPGQPTKYKPEYDRFAYVACSEMGATDEQLAILFNVNVATISNWKNQQPSFLEALRQGKDDYDTGLVEASLRDRATGYTVTETKVFLTKTGETIKVPIKKEYPPDATSMIFWLKNRKKQRWRDKVDQEISGPDGGPIQTQSITFTPVATDDE